MRHPLVVAAACAAACSLSACPAHFPRVDEPTLGLEPATFALPLARGQLLEGHGAFHLLLQNGLDDPRLWEEGGLAVSTSASLLLAARMVDEPSVPILPLSWIPRVRAQLAGVAPVGPAGERLHRLVGGLELTAAHYSNGQRGCAIADSYRGAGPSDFDCTLLPGRAPTTELNVVDGSFSLNEVALGALLRWTTFTAADGEPRTTLTVAGEAAWNPPCRFAGCIEDPLAERYGRSAFRWRAVGELFVLHRRHRAIPLNRRFAEEEVVRLSAFGAVHAGLGPGRAPFADATFQLAWLSHFERGGQGGWFVGYHLGRDDLNMRFERRFDAWTVGYTVDLGGATEHLRPRPAVAREPPPAPAAPLAPAP